MRTFTEIEQDGEKPLPHFKVESKSVFLYFPKACDLLLVTVKFARFEQPNLVIKCLFAPFNALLNSAEQQLSLLIKIKTEIRDFCYVMTQIPSNREG